VAAAELWLAAILDARAAYAHYETMPTDALERCRLAHQVDQAHATTPESIAFGAGRLALIAAVLHKRHVEADARD
jgi:hypothetical protein